MDSQHQNVVICAILIALSTGGLTNSLVGQRLRCQDEGERVAVDDIDKANCFSCICKNGFVECKNEYICPPTDGCHILVEKSNDGCCRRCKGCIYNGDHYPSHTEWTDTLNPCKVLRCEAGVVTESDMQCHTPCANPLKPEPGKCCPTCPECKINGQVATDDRDVISDDPCLKCRCSNGRMTCSKKACPVLQCVSAWQVHPPGECCPRCRGTRTLITANRTCTLQNALHREGQEYKIDKCTNCVCKNETSICQRAACPILNCAPDLQKSIPGSCCKQCIMPEEVRTQCSYLGKYYETGQSWKLNACRSCKCHEGMPSCAMTRCNVTLPCAAGTQLVHLPGECCQKCVDVEGVCMVFGDSHYKTFDGKTYTFRVAGKYQLVSECQSSSFTIRVANVPNTEFGKNAVTTRRIAVRYGDLRLNLQQKSRVKLNKTRVKLPYKVEGKISIERTKDNIELVLQNGVKIFWNGKSFLEVVVPTNLRGKLCGLCGNYNGVVQDELTPRHMHNATSDEGKFTRSWCVGRPCRQMQRGACKAHRPEKNRCKLLNNEELFGECDSKLDYSKYYKTCKEDSCDCPNGKCYCDSLMAYARECERLGVQLPNWRKKSSCDEHQQQHRNHHMKRTKLHKKRPAFTKEEIELFRMQNLKRLNRTQAPSLVE